MNKHIHDVEVIDIKISLHKLMAIFLEMEAPEGAEWCPLCSIAVKPAESKEAWTKHLRSDCYNNPRKHMSGVPEVDWG